MEGAYLGIDVGSTSVKAVLLDERFQIIDAVYLKNRGILESVIECLSRLIKNVDILACGITGSGRNFTNIIVGGDVVKTEVLAHSVATLFYYPEVRTIFEIGGEDCKLMIIEDGVLRDFKMNNICAGGTGAMLEAIANRMGLSAEEIGEMALKSEINLDLPGKCGIFCQSAVVNKLNMGVGKEDILMGICRALIRNYLTICKNTRLKPPYVFQGATAQNKGLVKALEDELRHPVIVPKMCAYMGAIGIAMMAKEKREGETKFKGFNAIFWSNYHIFNFQCEDCPNRCEVIQIFQDKKLAGGIGSRCCKWEFVERRTKDRNNEEASLSSLV